MHFKMSSAICFNLDQSKILSFGDGLSNDKGAGTHFAIYAQQKREKLLT